MSLVLYTQGESIEERGCDSAIPTCPTPILYVDTESEGGVGLVSREDNADGGGSMSGENNHHYHHHSHSQHRHSLHQLQLENVTLTPGCECGCILYDLVPERNDTLVIFISSNYSSPCADEDEVDHHKFKWIFHVSQSLTLCFKPSKAKHSHIHLCNSIYSFNSLDGIWADVV